MDYQFLKDLPDNGRNQVVYLLLADQNLEAFFTAVRSGYKVDSWVLEWLLLSRHGGYINQLMKEEATFTVDAFRFLKAYLGEASYNNWLLERDAQQKQKQKEKQEAEDRATMESLREQVEKEGFTPKLFSLFGYSNAPKADLLVELYGEEKVYEEAKKFGSIWKIASALSDDFLFSKKEYGYLRATLGNARKLIKLGELSTVYSWSTWHDQIKDLLNKEVPTYFLEQRGYDAYQRISKESKKNFTDEQWIDYYDRFHENAWEIIPLEDKHYLVDAMTRAKRRLFLLNHHCYGKFFKTFFC